MLNGERSSAPAVTLSKEPFGAFRGNPACATGDAGEDVANIVDIGLESGEWGPFKDMVVLATPNACVAAACCNLSGDPATIETSSLKSGEQSPCVLTPGKPVLCSLGATFVDRRESVTLSTFNGEHSSGAHVVLSRDGSSRGECLVKSDWGDFEDADILAAPNACAAATYCACQYDPEPIERSWLESGGSSDSTF